MDRSYSADYVPEKARTDFRVKVICPNCNSDLAIGKGKYKDGELCVNIDPIIIWDPHNPDCGHIACPVCGRIVKVHD